MGKEIHDFRKLRRMPAFVDKTLLIKAIITNSNSNFLITAPRRFGKTVNLSMIRRFFEICDNAEDQKENRRLFENLLIEKEKIIMNDYFGKFPVIFLNLRAIENIRCFDEAFSVICRAVKRAYDEHRYLALSDKLWAHEKEDLNKWFTLDLNENPVKRQKGSIINALQNLSYYLKQHWQKEVTVLVDEFDGICSSSFLYVKDIQQLTAGRCHYNATDEIEEIIDLSEATVSSLLKTNDNVDRGVITGISYLTSKGLSNLNTLEVIKFQEDSEFAPFYGLTLDECKNLLTKFNLDSNLEEVKQYYDGYRNDMLSIYSVVNYLRTKTTNTTENALKNYWSDSGIIAGFNDALKIIHIRNIIFKLLNNDPCNEIDILYYNTIVTENIVHLKNILSVNDIEEEFIDIYFNFVLEQGYLKITHLNAEEGRIKVKIPNKEIANVFRTKLRTFFKSKKLKLNEVEECARIFDKLRTSNEINRKLLHNIRDTLNEMIRKFTIEVKNESVVHHILYQVTSETSNFRFFSEVRASKKNRNRIDLLLLNDNFGIGIIIELKYSNTADVALNQIIANNYTDAFTYDKYTGDTFYLQYSLLIGLNMDENQNITLSVLFNTTDLKNYVNYD